jgi:hypothetical protein
MPVWEMLEREAYATDPLEVGTATYNRRNRNVKARGKSVKVFVARGYGPHKA